MEKIAGRIAEQQILTAALQSNKAELIALYGRRRIGKTYLVNSFFKDKGLFFELTGIKDASLKQQLLNFNLEFSNLFFNGKQQTTPSSWLKAFAQLQQQIGNISPEKKIILFFDEIPWLASPRSNFLGALEHFWNRHASRNNNVIVIICGSAASWMIKKIINNKGGLHGRLTRKIRLLPFTLQETKQFLQANNIDLDNKQIIEIYMAIGGVAKYLTFIERGKSSAQIINDICFSPNGALSREFHNLYHSLFNNAENHIKIIIALAQKISGLSKNEIIAKTKINSGGSLTNIMHELERSGFIAKIPMYGKSIYNATYRLIDEFSIFYLSWMINLNHDLNDVGSHYWLQQHAQPKYSTWAGLAFESICLKHLITIKQALGIAAVTSYASSWRYISRSAEDTTGAQIDLVIDRSDNCINLCEIKFSKNKLRIDKNYANNLNHKKAVFQAQTNSRKSLFTTLITTYGTEHNNNYINSVDQELTIDIFFS
ncbi:MAG: ATPase [Legionellales bacterium]|nr:MAG: ATPase [Legionellales bacterium]